MLNKGANSELFVVLRRVNVHFTVLPYYIFAQVLPVFELTHLAQGFELVSMRDEIDTEKGHSP